MDVLGVNLDASTCRLEKLGNQSTDLLIDTQATPPPDPKMGLGLGWSLMMGLVLGPGAEGGASERSVVTEVSDLDDREPIQMHIHVYIKISKARIGRFNTCLKLPPPQKKSTHGSTTSNINLMTLSRNVIR